MNDGLEIASTRWCQSTFECGILIDFEGGVVGEVRIRENEVPALVSAQKLNSPLTSSLTTRTGLIAN